MRRSSSISKASNRPPVRADVAANAYTGSRSALRAGAIVAIAAACIAGWSGRAMPAEALLAQATGTVPSPADVPAATKGSSTTGTTSETTSGAAVARTVDINSASEQELMSLPDIGPDRARQIVGSRPYTRTEELVERKLIPKNVFDEINDRLVAR